MTSSHSHHADKTKRATDPQANITVFASAGSGKTYLLVHRILKLLLNGVKPGHILAITFTRKAAAEMQERLMNVLAEWASVDDNQLKTTLENLSYPYDEASITKARKLYEELLFSDHEIRITTFHAFCQDILKRFAIYAGVPAGFRVAESTLGFKQQARKQLYKLAQHDRHEKLSQSLFTLLDHCNSVDNINQLLDTFIDSRSDWWSFTENQEDPIAYAQHCLNQLIDYQDINATEFFKNLAFDIKEYMNLMSLHDTSTNQSYCHELATFLESIHSQNQDYENIISVFFTNESKKRKLNASKALEKSLGAKKLLKLIGLHENLCEKLEQYIENQKKQALLDFNHAWFYAGFHLVEEYQQLKFSQHVLDFDDLEWYTYLLLNQHESAAWVQYKLDQRIQHILIDEFQDTNPTQWKLILPLLTELALDAQDHHRSLFFVGDSKQSIYGFRRANSELQFTAADWAEKNLSAEKIETDSSFRSSPAIINFVNQVFSQKTLAINNFNVHQAIHSDLWGEVQVERLFQVDKDSSSKNKQKAFRNPMLQAREDSENDSYYLEGRHVAEKISSLIASSITIKDSTEIRKIKFSDVMILARSRTHLAQLELALREQKIPYSSTYDKDFLAALEVQDMLALLTYLIQPHNDLALAQVLRSPLYAMSDEDLMQIFIQTGNCWQDKFKSYADNSNKTLAKQAYAQLQSWRGLANSLPVHDLLDQIYFQSDILQRYTYSCCNNLTQNEPPVEILENLTNLLQLSLDVDAGRYSSIQSFIQALQLPHASNMFSNNLQKKTQNAVQIMTIHSAKGLESPVVFLVDTGPQKIKSKTYQTVINWPSKAVRPEHFFVLGRKDSIDKNTQKIIDQQIEKERLEELNLLYVALTRAKQYLYISGSLPKNNSEHSIKHSWHSTITQAFKDGEDKALRLEHGIPLPAEYNQKQNTKYEAEYSLNLGVDLKQAFPKPENSDFDTRTEVTENKKSADYGTLVHKILELVDENYFQNVSDHEALKLVIETSLDTNIEQEQFEYALAEVRNCHQTVQLKEIFTKNTNKKHLKEVPISYLKNGNTYYRIIDHLILDETSVWIIDYKTTREVSAETLPNRAKEHLTQINSYTYAVKKLFPNKKLRVSILFTSLPALFDIEEEELNLIN